MLANGHWGLFQHDIWPARWRAHASNKSSSNALNASSSSSLAGLSPAPTAFAADADASSAVRSFALNDRPFPSARSAPATVVNAVVAVAIAGGPAPPSSASMLERPLPPPPSSRASPLPSLLPRRGRLDSGSAGGGRFVYRKGDVFRRGPAR